MDTGADPGYLIVWLWISWAVALPVLLAAGIATLISLGAGRGAAEAPRPRATRAAGRPGYRSPRPGTMPPRPPWVPQADAQVAGPPIPRSAAHPGMHAPGNQSPGMHAPGLQAPRTAAPTPGQPVAGHLAPGHPVLGRSQGGRPAPSPARTDRSVLYPNLLLGVACLFVLAAAVVFAGISQSAVLRAVSIWAVALLAYGAGLLLHGLAPRLRPIGIALTGLGLALVPIAGGLLGGLSLTSPSLAWFISSAVGALCYGFAAFRLRSALITWFGLLFVLSLVLSMMALTPAPTVWYFCALVLAATAFAVAARLLTGRVHPAFVLPHLVLGEVVAPAAVVASVFIDPFPSAWAWAALFAVLGVHYLVGAWCLGSTVRGPIARLALSTSLIWAVGATIGSLWPDQPPATQAGTMVLTALALSAGFLGEALLHRRRTLATWFVLGVAAGIGLIATLVSPFSLASPLVRPLAGGTIALTVLLVVLLVVCALRFDLPPARAGAVALGCTLGPWAAAALGVSDAEVSPSSGAPYLFLMVGLVLVLAADGAGAAWITSKRGRHLLHLRRSAPLLSAVTSGTLLAPAFGAPDAGHPLLAFGGYLVLLLALCAAAWAVRSALLLTGAIPLVTAAALTVASSYGADGLRMTAPVPNDVVRLGLTVALLGGVVVAEVLLLRAGRRWRARYAGTMALLLAGAVALDVLVPVFPAPDSDLGLGVLALGAVGGLLLLHAVVVFGHRMRPRAPGSRHAPPGLGSTAVWVGLGALTVLTVFRAGQASTLFAVITCVLLAAAGAHATLVHRNQWLLLPVAAASAIAVIKLSGLPFDDGALRTVVSAWVVWALWYGCYWALTSAGKPATAPLAVAFAAAVTAIVATPLLDVEVPWLNSVTQLAVGVSVTIPALMLALLTARVRDTTIRRILPECASFVGAIGLMVAAHGVVSTALVVNLHFLAAVAWLWAWLADRRGDAPVGGTLRRVISAAAVSLTGVYAGLVDGGWYTVLFLVDHVALLVYGAVRSRAWALWWGLGASVAAIVWFLRDLVWLALIVLALVLIGVVVWLLLRKPQDQTRGGQRPGPGGPAGPEWPGYPPGPGYSRAPGAPGPGFRQTVPRVPQAGPGVPQAGPGVPGPRSAAEAAPRPPVPPHARPGGIPGTSPGGPAPNGPAQTPYPGSGGRPEQPSPWGPPGRAGRPDEQWSPRPQPPRPPGPPHTPGPPHSSEPPPPGPPAPPGPPPPNRSPHG